MQAELASISGILVRALGTEGPPGQNSYYAPTGVTCPRLSDGGNRVWRAALRLVFYFGMDTGVVVHRLALGFGAAALGRLALWLPKWGMYEGRALVEMLVSCLYPKAVDDSVTVTVTLTAILIFTLT